MKTRGRAALLAALIVALRPRAALALDAASLQFTVPAPDPAQAGETIALQALAVNTGTSQWDPGTYYWVAEIYDLDYHLIARTDQVSPRDAVGPGAVASISLPFHIPDTMSGRKLYRVFLVKDTKTLIESDYKGFQISEKPIPPPPETVTYHMEGNLTTSFKDSSLNKWRNANGATTFNTIGKIKDNSYLINLYILHQPGNIFNPFIIVGNFYAPWGTIYGGDIQPNLGPLAVSGQGMRGVMLEQKKDIFDWDVLGGQTVGSQAGTATTNGRYARSLYAAKFGISPGGHVKINLNYFLSSDEVGSLSSNPNSPNFRGPSLLAQKNSGEGFDISWEPITKLKFLAAYQQNTFFADVNHPGAKDKAIRGETSFERKWIKFRAYIQRAGTNFVAFGNPGIVGDRLTYDGLLTLFPKPWYTFTLNGDQYRDNLANNPTKTTTTQRVINVTNAFQLRTATSFSVNGSLNTAKGNPVAALDNQTTTAGVAVGQLFGKHSVSLNVQDSQFRDKNRLADDLDTMTASLSSSWKLPHNCAATFGVTDTDTKDKTNGSKRASLSVAPSFTAPLAAKWTGQFWATWTATKNTSPTNPADTTLLALNSEYTWNYAKQISVTFGVGGNVNKDKLVPGNSYKELTASLRYSYTF